MKMTDSPFADSEPAPDWFQDAISASHESNFWTAPDGCNIHFLRWCRSATDPVQSLKDRRKDPQGVVFIHGTAAHAHWWHHIAPQLAEGSEGYDVLAISLSGHGDSDDRPKMDPSVWVDDIISVMQSCGLLDLAARAAPPVIIGHSMGGYVAVDVARRVPQHVGGIILLDTAVPHPLFFLMEKQLHKKQLASAQGDITRTPTSTSARSHGADTQPSSSANQSQPRRRAYPMTTLPASRLQLSPPQQIRNPFIVEHVANMSVRAVIGSKEGEKSWEWKVDPGHRKKLPFMEYIYNVGTPDVLHTLRTRIAIFYGEDSVIVPDTIRQYMRHTLGEHIAITGIPDAEHHCLFDQPHAIVAMLRVTLAEWGRSATGAYGSGTTGLPLPRMRARSVESDWVDADLVKLYNLLPNNYTPPSQAAMLTTPQQPRYPLPIGAKL
eukprot:m.395943 g.395943  ORF g.395943 m.395943 type:complete len:436 (+) comp21105_c0_seq30:561-1868(+)